MNSSKGVADVQAIFALDLPDIYLKPGNAADNCVSNQIILVNNIPLIIQGCFTSEGHMRDVADTIADLVVFGTSLKKRATASVILLLCPFSPVKPQIQSMNRGVVIKSTGKHYIVKDLMHHDLKVATIRGKFKLQGYKLTNPVGVGDKVGFQILEDGTAVIEEIESRKNYVVRQSPRKKHSLHLLASNIDQALLIVTIKEPMLKPGFIDRFLLMTEPYNIPVHILFNKCDIYGEAEINMFHYMKSIYKPIGYTVSMVSAVEGSGFEELLDLLAGKLSLVAGQSGVGKSSLINRIVPDLEIRVNTISDYSGKGQHTTTFAEMHQISENTHIIDTPGIKTLGFNHLEVMDVAHNFREIFKTSVDCKFGDCTHRNEPKCAVKEAIEREEISELRYFSYIKILNEIENQNYWERIKDY